MTLSVLFQLISIKTKIWFPSAFTDHSKKCLLHPTSYWRSELFSIGTNASHIIEIVYILLDQSSRVSCFNPPYLL
uniref:Uncharacterized protein n=1 Tax=Pararge aegeria TaxID=116150 RepID=S4NS97_9NEOP